MFSANIVAARARFRARPASLGLLAILVIAAAFTLVQVAARAQVIGTTSGYYSDTFDQHGNSTSTTTVRLNSSQTGGSAYYVSGNAPNGGDNARMSGPWERANRPLGQKNATPFVMFWTDASGPNIGTSVADRTYYSFRVPVEVNARYRLTYDYGLLNSSSPAVFQTYINGAQAGSNLTTTGAYNDWLTATHIWSSGSNTSMTVALVNNNGSKTQGNDFALDDVLLVKLADLMVSKSDGVTSVVRNSNSTYNITVSHGAASSPVAGAILTDAATSGLVINSISCAAVANNVCTTAPTVAQLQAGFAMPNIPIGSVYQIAVNTTATTTASTITNSATVTMPANIVDEVPNNNSASDTNSVTPSTANLGITKTDNVSVVTSGNATAYIVTVNNAGPNPVAGAILKDAAATGLVKTSITCSSTPGNCTAATTPTIAQIESSGGYALPLLAANQSYQIIVNSNVTATGGTVTNTATVTAPNGTSDPDLANNSAGDTNSVERYYAITLRKIWINPLPNDTVNLGISGAQGAVSGTSQAGAPTETSANASAASGSTTTLRENFTRGSAGSYTTSFACTRNSNIICLYFNIG